MSTRVPKLNFQLALRLSEIILLLLPTIVIVSYLSSVSVVFVVVSVSLPRSRHVIVNIWYQRRPTDIISCLVLGPCLLESS